MGKGIVMPALSKATLTFTTSGCGKARTPSVEARTSRDLKGLPEIAVVVDADEDVVAALGVGRLVRDGVQIHVHVRDGNPLAVKGSDDCVVDVYGLHPAAIATHLNLVPDAKRRDQYREYAREHVLQGALERESQANGDQAEAGEEPSYRGAGRHAKQRDDA